MFKRMALVWLVLMITFGLFCSKKTTKNDEEQPVTEIDLSAYAAFFGTDSAKTVPNMSSLVLHALSGKLYVACQRLNGWNPGDTSLLVVINTTTDKVEKVIKLRYKNPRSMYLLNGKIYVCSIGAWDAKDAGIEVVNTQNDSSEGGLISESTIGGDAYDVAVKSGKGYLIVSSYPNNEVIPFNPSTGALSAKLPGITGAEKMAFDRQGNLFVLNRDTTATGIYVFDTNADTLIKGPLATGLPPNDICFATTGSVENAYIATTDFTSGYLRYLPENGTQTSNNIRNIYKDASLKSRSGYLYILEKMGSDKIIKLALSNLTTPVGELAVGSASNLQDMAFLNDNKAYVTRNNATTLLIVDPSTM